MDLIWVQKGTKMTTKILRNYSKQYTVLIKCEECSMKFTDEKRFARHFNTHVKKAKKNKKKKDNN